MDNKNNYLFNLIVAAAAITTTLFLLNKYLNKNNNQLAGLPADSYNNTDMPSNLSFATNKAADCSNIQKVEVVKPEPCLFPDELLINFESKYTQPNWGELNQNAPDIPGNNF